MSTKIQLRRGAASAWTSANPVLAAGEPGYESDTGSFKIGNGVATWNAMGYSAMSQAQAAAIFLDQDDAAAQYGTLAAIDSARTLALRGAPKKTNPVKSMWLNVGAVGHGVVSQGAAGSVFDLNNTTTYALGDRCAKVTTDGAGGYTWLTKTGLSINADDQYVRVWLHAEDISKVGNVYLFLGDTTMANNYRASLFVATAENKSGIKSGEWTAFDVPWSAFSNGTITGTPSRGAITAIRFQVSDTNLGSPAVVRLNGVAGLAEPATFPNGVVSLTFDDCFLAADTVARPIMDKYGYAGTLYPIIDQFDQPGKLTLASAKRMRDANGWDFGFHAFSQASHDAGQDTLTEAGLIEEYESMIGWASANDVRGDSLAWPLITSSSLSQLTAANYFSAARGGLQTMSETVPPSQRMNLRCIGVSATATIAALKIHIDKAKAGKTWAVFTFHGIVSAGATANDTTTAIFQELIDYIAAQGVDVRTVAQVMGAGDSGLSQAGVDAMYLTGDVQKAGGFRLVDSFPEVKSALGGDVVHDPGGAELAAWQVQMNGDGRLFHLRLGPTVGNGALLAMGLDYGNANYPQGILLANKAQSRGMTVDNMTTVTDALAYGLYVRNSSSAAPGAKFEQSVAGASIAARFSSEYANANQKMVDFRSNVSPAVTEEAGHVRADNGWLIWSKIVKPGTYTTVNRVAITGLGSSTRGAFVYDSDLDALAVYTAAGWRRSITGPTTLPTVTTPAAGSTIDAESRTAIGQIKTILQGLAAAS